MRVLVTTDRIGALSSWAAGQTLALGWPSAQVVVVPVGTAGDGFLQAVADGWGVPLQSEAATGTTAGAAVVTTATTADEAALRVERTAPYDDGWSLDATSAPLGAALAALLDQSALRRVFLDLTGLGSHDGGAGLLGALGATADVPLDAGVAGLDGLGQLELSRVRSRLGGTELVGVVPAAELGQPLLGLRGITSLHGRAAGLDAEVLLRTDAALERWAQGLAPEQAGVPGAGACGGLGLAVLGVGGRLTTGPAVGLAAAPLRGGRAAPDLVVTGCSVFDFATRGGGVVAAAAEAAAGVLAPCVVVAGEVLIGAREMRTMGIEAAYAVRESSSGEPGERDVAVEELAAVARRVGRSWSW